MSHINWFEIEELPVKISCIERLGEQRSKHVIVLEVGRHSWIWDGELMGVNPRSNITEKTKTGMCPDWGLAICKCFYCFRSAWSGRWVGFSASVHMSAGSLISKTFQKLKCADLIGKGEKSIYRISRSRCCCLAWKRSRTKMKHQCRKKLTQHWK